MKNIIRSLMLSIFMISGINPSMAQWIQTGSNNGFIQCITASGTNLFAGGSGGVFLSTNDGTSWITVDSGLTNPYVYALTFSGTNLFAGTWGGGAFLSTNNGTSWKAIDSNLTSPFVYSFAVSGTNLFAATYNGVFLSTNNGTSWSAARYWIKVSLYYCFWY